MFLILVGIYRATLSGILGGSCRFEPSCSEYAVQCLHQHSFLQSQELIFKRLLKCRPWGPSGYDPVPHRSKAVS